jgi:hypothetical protein
MGDLIIRSRLDGLTGSIDRAGRLARCGCAGRLVQVYSGGSIPTVLPAFFLAHPVSLGGDETEGAAATVAVDSDETIPVYVIGSRVPVAGDILAAHATGGRWVAVSGKSGSGDACYANCGESKIPATDITVVSTTKSNGHQDTQTFRHRVTASGNHTWENEFGATVFCDAGVWRFGTLGIGFIDEPLVIESVSPFYATVDTDTILYEFFGPDWWPDPGEGDCVFCGDCLCVEGVKDPIVATYNGKEYTLTKGEHHPGTGDHPAAAVHHRLQGRRGVAPDRRDGGVHGRRGAARRSRGVPAHPDLPQPAGAPRREGADQQLRAAPAWRHRAGGRPANGTRRSLTTVAPA